jgi:hypothetical protein
MGATGWKCFVPFEADAESVLDKARLEAFASRAYGKPYARGEPRTDTMEQLIEAFCEDGTCSVIDVSEIADEPDIGRAGPFPAEILKDALGTVRPTRAQAEDGLSNLFDQLERGYAAYVVCFEKGRPSEVLFLGYSFD